MPNVTTIPESFASPPDDTRELHHHVESSLMKWECSILIHDVDETTGKPVLYDICECLAMGWEFKFPAKYRGLAARKQLVMELKLAAILSGFCLSTRTSAMERNSGHIKRRAFVTLFCEKGKLHRLVEKRQIESNGESNDKMMATNNATKNESLQVHSSKRKRCHGSEGRVSRSRLHETDACPFHFTIYMVSEDAPTDAGRWFLSSTKVNRSTCACHLRHSKLPENPSLLLSTYIANLSEENKALAKQCVGLHFTAPSVAAVLSAKNLLDPPPGNTSTTDQSCHPSPVHQESSFEHGPDTSSTSDRPIGTPSDVTTTATDQVNDARYQRRLALLRSCHTLASGSREMNDLIDTLLEEMHRTVIAAVSSRQS
ncbi:hypothetical protein IV203_026943 [Nitzschia inconspicua]|uniref:Uncharacterized protein n=1 Tax=Nitzschia inconspicua TaxID=303405 RepID=A0A9K3PXP0_9STRA|nr:hypothetical protein IV203_026943 [Nitzschia inconspicua]